MCSNQKTSSAPCACAIYLVQGAVLRNALPWITSMCFIWNKLQKKAVDKGMASLRVERHPRGHIAACNGRLEILNTRVESCTNYRPGNASENAQKFDACARRERERKAYQLESFQKRVKHRVCQRERERQREIAAVSGELVKSEQRAAEKAVKLDRIKVSGLIHNLAKFHCIYVTTEPYITLYLVMVT